MSQPSITTFGSWGLIAGRRMVPPPPGPITRQASSRALRAGPGSAAAASVARAAAASRMAGFTVSCGPPILSSPRLRSELGARARGSAPRSPPTGGTRAGSATAGGPLAEGVEERGRLAVEPAELEERRPVAHAVAAEVVRRAVRRRSARAGPASRRRPTSARGGRASGRARARLARSTSTPATGQNARWAVAPEVMTASTRMFATPGPSSGSSR